MHFWGKGMLAVYLRDSSEWFPVRKMLSSRWDYFYRGQMESFTWCTTILQIWMLLQRSALWLYWTVKQSVSVTSSSTKSPEFLGAQPRFLSPTQYLIKCELWLQFPLLFLMHYDVRVKLTFNYLDWKLHHFIFFIHRPLNTKISERMFVLNLKIFCQKTWC